MDPPPPHKAMKADAQGYLGGFDARCSQLVDECRLNSGRDGRCCSFLIIPTDICLLFAVSLSLSL